MEFDQFVSMWWFVQELKKKERKREFKEKKKKEKCQKEENKKGSHQLLRSEM